MKAWCVISLGDDRQYGGNEGYNDVPTSVYRYDSNVANHKQVSAGDIVVIRDRQFACGIARIVEVMNQPGHKTVQRCPICGSTSIKRRKTKNPDWRCSCGQEFSHPRQKEEQVELYEAHYGETYVPLPRTLQVSSLKSAMPRPSDQLSIEEVDTTKLEALMESVSTLGAETIRRAATAQRLLAQVGQDDSEADNYVPSSAEQSDRVLQSIRVRRGQSRFRKLLLERYEARCVVTGCTVLDLLEAAHIVPYKTKGDHDPSTRISQVDYRFRCPDRGIFFINHGVDDL